jgi:hypothetical protein
MQQLHFDNLYLGGGLKLQLRPKPRPVGGAETVYTLDALITSNGSKEVEESFQKNQNTRDLIKWTKL